MPSILVMGASSGIRSELVRVWSRITALGLPCLLFLNELDKDGCLPRRGVARCVNAILGFTPLPMSLPYGSGAQLEGRLDLLQQSLITSRAETAPASAVTDT